MIFGDIMGINWDIIHIYIYIYNYMYIIFYSQQYDIWVYPSNMHDICMVDPCRSNILDAKILDER